MSCNKKLVNSSLIALRRHIGGGPHLVCAFIRGIGEIIAGRNPRKGYGRKQMVIPSTLTVQTSPGS